MDERFNHPWFGILKDIKKKAADAGLTEKEIIELPQMIIWEINREIKPPYGRLRLRLQQPARGRSHGRRNMLNLKEKDIPAAREIAERVLAECIVAKEG